MMTRENTCSKNYDFTWILLSLVWASSTHPHCFLLSTFYFHLFLTFFLIYFQRFYMYVNRFKVNYFFLYLSKYSLFYKNIHFIIQSLLSRESFFLLLSLSYKEAKSTYDLLTICSFMSRRSVIVSYHFYHWFHSSFVDLQ